MINSVHRKYPNKTSVNQVKTNDIINQENNPDITVNAGAVKAII